MVTSPATHCYTALPFVTARPRQSLSPEYVSSRWRRKDFLMTNKIISGLSALLLLLSGAHSSIAQAQTGSIHGTVADPSGAVVPSASVTLTSQGGDSRFALSGGDGAFVIDSVAPGSY